MCVSRRQVLEWKELYYNLELHTTMDKWCGNVAHQRNCLFALKVGLNRTNIPLHNNNVGSFILSIKTIIIAVGSLTTAASSVDW